MTTKNRIRKPFILEPTEEGYQDEDHLEAKAEFLDELVRLIRSGRLIVALKPDEKSKGFPTLLRNLTIEEIASVVRRGG